MGVDDRETLLVVLGAGASFDCIPGWQLQRDPNPVLNCAGLPQLPFSDVVPPLTQDLAEARPLVNWALDRWPQARPAIAHLRSVLNQEPTHLENEDEEALSLEQALAEFQTDADLVPENRRSILGVRFFLRDLIWASTNYMMSGQLTAGVTNYIYLLGSVNRWAGRGDRRVVIISFNYDLLLERAMTSSWGFDATKAASYLAHPRIKLLKPHGSLQWEWPLSGDNSPLYVPPLVHGEISIERALTSVEQRDNLRTLTHATFERDTFEQSSGVPAMALPLVGKNEYCWPADQQELFNELQGSVSRLITIGWRGMEQHFVPQLRPLVRDTARALVVAGGSEGNDESLKARARLQSFTDCDISRWVSYGGGFTRLLRERQVDMFLTG